MLLERLGICGKSPIEENSPPPSTFFLTIRSTEGKPGNNKRLDVGDAVSFNGPDGGQIKVIVKDPRKCVITVRDANGIGFVNHEWNPLGSSTERSELGSSYPFSARFLPKGIEYDSGRAVLILGPEISIQWQKE